MVTDTNGTLEAKIMFPDDADVVTDEDDDSIMRLRITNKYDPKAVASELDVEKTLTGRNLKAEEFNFSMTGLNKQQAGTGYEDARWLQVQTERLPMVRLLRLTCQL